MMFRIPLCVSLLLAASPLGYSMPANNAASPYLSKGGPISAREGSRVVLACNTEKIDGYINMWSFKNSQKVSRTLFAGDIAIQQMAGVSLDKETGAVVIENMQPEFVGMFNCKISDPNLSDSIQYNLSIQTAPMIAPVPAQGKVSVRKEAPIFLRCNVQSDVPFSVQWTHQSKIIEDNAEVLEIPRASSVHEGKYTCIAKNEIGERSFSFDVEVEYEPEIKLSEKVIHGPIGDNVEVRCEVNAHPKADIAWYFGNNERVQKSRKHDITNFDKYSVLRISNVDLKDYRQYYCQASNPLQTVTEFFEITGRPSKPKFTSAPSGTDSDAYMIDWTVFSQSPITDYNMKIREIDHSTGQRGNWRHVSVTPKNDDQGPIRRQTYQIDNLSEFNSYEVELEVKNEHGTTSSEIFKFATTSANSAVSMQLSIFIVAIFALVANLFN